MGTKILTGRVGSANRVGLNKYGERWNHSSSAGRVSEKKIEIKSRKSNNNRSGQDNEQSRTNDLKFIYFNVRSITGK